MDVIHRVSLGKDRYHQHREIIEWCEENCGEGGYGSFSRDENAKWSVDGIFGNHHFFFKDEKDFIMFTLRWL